MCNQGCRTDDCAHQREGDTWLTPRQPVSLPPLAPADVPQAPGGPNARESASEAIPAPEPTHGPALTRDGFTEALLRRDGGR